MARRSDTGEWDLFGGTRKSLEHVHRTLKRETLEEGNVQLRQYKFVGTYRLFKARKMYRLGVYRANIRPGLAIKLSPEHSEARLFTRAQLAGLGLRRELRQILERALDEAKAEAIAARQPGRPKPSRIFPRPPRSLRPRT